MIVSRLALKNWRNFQTVDVSLKPRVFLAGPNASGKSNLLDVFRFFRDVAKKGGGLQEAIGVRGGLAKIRCLAARQDPVVALQAEIGAGNGSPPEYRYEIGIRQEQRGHRLPQLTHERVWRRGAKILERPDAGDRKDLQRLTQTHLEQINANSGFRELARFFEGTLYLHLIPQVLRFPEAFGGRELAGDPFGRTFLERVALTPLKTRQARLRKIEGALKAAVPQLTNLTLTTDERGIPHLAAVHKHWRPKAGKQMEDQFSDGTLRLIALLWSLLEGGESPLLLEEPELSLNGAIVSQLPGMMHKMQRFRQRQILVSTHSIDLLADKGIGGEEVLLLQPGTEGTVVTPAHKNAAIRALLDSGFSVGEAAMPAISPEGAAQLSFF